MCQVMSDLFEPEPDQWGLRADPWVWAAMRSRLVSTAVPPGPRAVQHLLLDTFAEVVGVDLSVDPLPEEQQLVHPDQAAQGGSPSGFVDALRWQRRLIPLLVSRAGRARGTGGLGGDGAEDAASASGDPVREQHAGIFEDAWRDLVAQCHDAVAPEATYEAWLAHFMMARLSPLHVVREVDFGARQLLPTTGERTRPLGNLVVDLLTLRRPIAHLHREAPHGVREPPDGLGGSRSGLDRLADFSVITDLEIAATRTSRLGYGEVVEHFQKLSVILDAAEAAYPDEPLPAAYVGVFVDVTQPVFSFDLLRRRLGEVDLRRDVQLAAFDVRSREVSFGPVR